LIYNLGRGVELGGGALSTTEQGSYTAHTESREAGVLLRRNIFNKNDKCR
jgi:hypothetical protein